MALPKRSWLFALLAFAVLLSTFDGTLSGGPAAAPSAAGVEDTRQALQGTWLRETTADGMTAFRGPPGLRAPHPTCHGRPILPRGDWRGL